MPSIPISRRALTVGLAAIPIGIAAVGRVAATDSQDRDAPQTGEGLSDSSQAIHQEVTFGATPERVYRALTTTKQFDEITRLSNAADLLAAPGAKPTSISAEPGGLITLFGGYVTGRNLELLPNERLVQAWRAGSWPPGAYSIVRFALLVAGGGTKLVFDHRGFPNGQGASLAYGWRVHYWEPLAKFLSQK
jgi:uncharacterized protein YndB with AHSA1/START domain